MANVRTEVEGAVLTVTIDRPEVRNAVDPATAALLRQAFASFDGDDSQRVAILTGAGGTFCAGFDLKALADGQEYAGDPSDGPMGPTRMDLTKPVLAAIEGYAVGGGLEMALWCDLRVMARDATLGVFNRRFGVPLIDGGTVRLPRLIGQGRALDLILTGRPVHAEEALRIGLVERVVDAGRALTEAMEIARRIADFPQAALGADRRNALAQWSLDEKDALLKEASSGMDVMASGEAHEGARRFAQGTGRHGS
jgi:enoyl-CoA hydratase